MPGTGSINYFLTELKPALIKYLFYTYYRIDKMLDLSKPIIDALRFHRVQ